MVISLLHTLTHCFSFTDNNYLLKQRDRTGILGYNLKNNILLFQTTFLFLTLYMFNFDLW